MAQNRRMTKAERKEFAREEARRRQEEEAQRKRRTRTWIIAGSVVAVLLIAIVAIVIIQSQKTPAIEETTQPSNAIANGGLVFGDAKEGDAADVDVYFDYMCPGCGAFEKAESEFLSGLANEGKIRLVMHPMANLDQLSAGTKYSSRSANAAATVSNFAQDKFLAFNSAMFNNQPKENSSGLTDDQIAQIAQTAGVPSSVTDKFKQNLFQDWVKSATIEDRKRGFTSTPAVYVDGTLVDFTKTQIGEQFEALVNEAVAKYPAGKNSSTSNPTSTK